MFLIATAWGFCLLPLLAKQPSKALANDHFITMMVAIVLQATLWIVSVGYVIGARGLLFERRRWWQGLLPAAVLSSMFLLPVGLAGRRTA